MMSKVKHENLVKVRMLIICSFEVKEFSVNSTGKGSLCFMLTCNEHRSALFCISDII